MKLVNLERIIIIIVVILGVMFAWKFLILHSEALIPGSTTDGHVGLQTISLYAIKNKAKPQPFGPAQPQDMRQNLNQFQQQTETYFGWDWGKMKVGRRAAKKRKVNAAAHLFLKIGTRIISWLQPVSKERMGIRMLKWLMVKIVTNLVKFLVYIVSLDAEAYWFLICSFLIVRVLIKQILAYYDEILETADDKIEKRIKKKEEKLKKMEEEKKNDEELTNNEDEQEKKSK